MMECAETLVVEFVTTVAGDLYQAALKCDLMADHESEDHWDDRGFFWRPFMPGPVLLGATGAQAGEDNRARPARTAPEAVPVSLVRGPT